jgi:hypothetical protein
LSWLRTSTTAEMLRRVRQENRGVDLTRYVFGLDLGKLSDFSAFCVVRWPFPAERMVTAKERAVSRMLVDYDIPILRRWPLGTPYTRIADDVVKFYRQPKFEGLQPILVVDTTGVGEAVYELLRERMTRAGMQGGTCSVYITGGAKATQVGEGRFNVAKRVLVSVLQALLGSRRLHVHPQLPDAKVLVKELQTFQVKITDAGNESFESWRERDHDDLVLAVALACWGATTLDPLEVPEQPKKAKTALERFELG